jgi:beta-glucosidase
VKNFSGRLPITWPKKLEDFPPFSRGDQVPNPMEYNVGYRWFDVNGTAPRFAFGHGLSYSQFVMEQLRVPCATVASNGLIPVEVDVRNVGTRAGDEVVLVFTRYPQSKVVRSPKELKGYARVTLQPGEAQRVSIPLRVHDMRYWDEDHRDAEGKLQKSWVVEEGPVEILVGPSSDKLELMTTVAVQGGVFQ